MDTNYVIAFYGGIFLIGIMLLVFWCLHDMKKEKKQRKEVDQYLSVKRNTLFEQAYPGYAYSSTYSGNLENEWRDKYNSYVFFLETMQNECEIKIRNTIRHEVSSDDESETDIFSNCFSIYVQKPKNSYFSMEGDFYVYMGSRNILKFISRVTGFEEMINPSDMRVNGNENIGRVGRILYRNIPPDKWKQFYASPVLKEIEALLILFKNNPCISCPELVYEHRHLELKFNDREYFTKGYMVIKNDFIINNHEIIKQTVSQLERIARYL